MVWTICITRLAGAKFRYPSTPVLSTLKPKERLFARYLIETNVDDKETATWKPEIGYIGFCRAGNHDLG